jgi:SAM-dependent methyltransferase
VSRAAWVERPTTQPHNASGFIPPTSVPSPEMNDGLVFPVPNSFRRGAHGGHKLVETGKQILDLVCDAAGIEDLAGLDILDYGSGYRMAQVLAQYDMAYNSYCGIDIDPEMMAWLQEHSPDSRMAFELVPFRNEMYRPEGETMTLSSDLPVGDARYDVMMMFSVVTHLDPDDTRSLFAILRRYLRPDGFLFFSAFVNPLMEEDFAEGTPEKPLWMAIYREGFLFDMLDATGWAVEYYAEPRGQLIQHQLLCRPTNDPSPPRPPRLPGTSLAPPS